MAVAPTQFGTGNWSQVGSGVFFGCALPQGGGKPSCWSTGYADAPVAAAAQVNESLVQLSVGSYHACGLSAVGRMYCWGDGTANALGNGIDNENSTYSASNTSDWAYVSAGTRFTCGIKNDSSLWCWGSNANHEVSPSNLTVILKPYRVRGNWSMVSAGQSYTLAINNASEALGWGLTESLDYDSSIGGMLGDGTEMCFDPVTNKFCSNDNGASDDYGFEFFKSNEARPVPVTGGLKFQSVSAGAAISCGVEQGTGLAYCWGYTTGEANAEGAPMTNAPKLLSNDTWLTINVGTSNSRCGLQTDGSLWCWGRNTFNCEGQCPLGDGTLNNSAVPVKVINVENWLPTELAPAPTPAPGPAAAPAPAPGPTPTPTTGPADVPSPPPPSSAPARHFVCGTAAAALAAGVFAVF